MNWKTPSARAWRRRIASAAIVAAVAAVVSLISANHPKPSPEKPGAAAVAVTPASTVTLRLATYNVRNYNSINRRVDGQYKPNWPKPEAEKTALRAVIRNAHPDVLAIEEIGGEPQLTELSRDLAAEGLTYTYSALVNGPDPDRHVALLSRWPLAQLKSREKISYKVNGGTDVVKRGLLEVELVTNGQHWVLYVVHLKSRLTETADDPKSAGQREAEARAVRDIIRQEQPLANGALVAVAGDFNDSRDSPPLKRFLELNSQPLLLLTPAVDSHGENWTSSYLRADQYDRSDYILLSSALAPWQKNPGGVVDIPETATASDHRLVWVDLAFPAASAHQ